MKFRFHSLIHSSSYDYYLFVAFEQTVSLIRLDFIVFKLSSALESKSDWKSHFRQREKFCGTSKLSIFVRGFLRKVTELYKKFFRFFFFFFLLFSSVFPVKNDFLVSIGIRFFFYFLIHFSDFVNFFLFIFQVSFRLRNVAGRKYYGTYLNLSSFLRSKINAQLLLDISRIYPIKRWFIRRAFIPSH